jgi:hypothetical protein
VLEFLLHPVGFVWISYWNVALIVIIWLPDLKCPYQKNPLGVTPLKFSAANETLLYAIILVISEGNNSSFVYFVLIKHIIMKYLVMICSSCKLDRFSGRHQCQEARKSSHPRYECHFCRICSVRRSQEDSLQSTDSRFSQHERNLVILRILQMFGRSFDQNEVTSHSFKS